MKNIFNIHIRIRILCIYVYFIFMAVLPTSENKPYTLGQLAGRMCSVRFTGAVTLFMGSLREAIPRDGRADDLEHQVVLGLCEQGQDPVELIEGTRPAVDQHERHHLLPLTMGRTDTNEVHV